MDEDARLILIARWMKVAPWDLKRQSVKWSAVAAEVMGAMNEYEEWASKGGK